MYRIMTMPAISDALASWELQFSTELELDNYVEDLLNNKGYAKSDFIIVTVKDYDVSTDIAWQI